MRDYTCVTKMEHGRRKTIHLDTDMAIINVDLLKRQANNKKGKTYTKRLAQFKIMVLEKCNYRCVECGETKCLTLDHKTPLKEKFKKINRSDLIQYIQPDAQILCAYCHRDKDGYFKTSYALCFPRREIEQITREMF